MVSSNSYNLTSAICLQMVFSTWPIDRTLPGVSTPGQREPESNVDEEVLRIPQISKAGGTSSDGLMSYLGHSLLRVGSYPSAEMQWVSSTAATLWVDSHLEVYSCHKLRSFRNVISSLSSGYRKYTVRIKLPNNFTFLHLFWKLLFLMQCYTIESDIIWYYL